MRTAIIAPSAATVNDVWRCSKLHGSIVGWPSIIVHARHFNTVGATSAAAIEEVIDTIGISRPYIGTLARGGYHDKSGDPNNGFVEYIGGYAYLVWPWQQVIHWLVYGWPCPKTDNVDAPPGTWCWLDQGDRPILPMFTNRQQVVLAERGVPWDVFNSKRLLTEDEAVNVAIDTVKKYRRRATPNN